MKNVFDETAERFARSIDVDINHGKYVRGQLFLELVKRTLPKPGLVLDYGCGPGRLGVLLARAGFRVHGVDTSKGMVAQALRQDYQGLDIRFETIRGIADIAAPAAYDGIVCSSVIEYVADPSELLAGFHRLLHEKGILIISYANETSLYRRRWRRAGIRNPMVAPGGTPQTWNWREFRALLLRNGFRAIDRPRFFESPLDWRYSRLVRKVALVGQLGVVAARRERPEQRAATRT